MFGKELDPVMSLVEKSWKGFGPCDVIGRKKVRMELDRVTSLVGKGWKVIGQCDIIGGEEVVMEFDRVTSLAVFLPHWRIITSAQQVRIVSCHVTTWVRRYKTFFPSVIYQFFKKAF
jgi:hypothetical protein